MALIVPVAAPAILSFSMCVLCVFIDLLRSPSLRRDGVDGVDCAGVQGVHTWQTHLRRETVVLWSSFVFLHTLHTLHTFYKKVLYVVYIVYVVCTVYIMI